MRPKARVTGSAHQLRWKLSFLVIGALIGSLLNLPAASSAPPPAPDTPVTVPALQQWDSGGSDFVLETDDIHLQVDAEYADQLTDDAKTFATDLRSLTGQDVVVQVRDAPPGAGPGVIRMTLDPSWTERGDEASRIVVDHDLTVSGPTDAGVFLGTRTVLQLLRQSTRIPGGVAEDWPGYAERSLMIDNGRKYFTPTWAKRQIRELSYLKYNQFHWHIADNAGFRIASETHPEIVSPDHWSKAEVRELLDYAAKYHIEVIPEIDMPGHMQYALRHHPELQVVDADGQRNPRNLDPTNPDARRFVQEILDELVPLFPGRYVHTGGDEFTGDWDSYPVLTDWAQEKYGPDANSHDAVLDFTNFIEGVVASHDKTMRMWNDGAQGGAVLEASRDIVLEYWSDQHGDVRAQEFLDRGYQLVNANRDALYDVPSATPSWNNLDPRKIFDQWDMSQWHDATGPNLTDPHADGILGGQLHVWNDRPDAATEEQEAGRLQMPLRALSQQLWDSSFEGDWDDLADRAMTVGTEPQWELLDGPGQNLALGGLTWSSDRERPDCHESMLVDGDRTTRWCGPKTAPQSVVIDLGETVDVGTVVLDWESAYARGYDVEISEDLSSWTTLAATDAGDGGIDRLDVDGHGRYLRLAMNERGTSWGYSLYEVEVYPRRALVPRDFTAEVNPDVVLLSPDASSAGTATLTNSSDRGTTVSWSTNPPAGLDIEPSSGTVRIPADSSVDVDFRLTGDSEPGMRRIPITVTGHSLNESVQLAATEFLVTVPYTQVSDAYNNVGVTHDDDRDPPTLGTGFDGAGSSYSAEALAEVGVQPGTGFTVDGVTVHWPDAAPATANNVVANGQSIRLDRSGARIGIMAASTYGPAAGDWVVHYDDGSTQTVRLSTPDWSSAASTGSTELVTMPYRNNASTGRADRTTRMFFQSFAIDPDKIVTAVTLPAVSAEAVRGDPALHVLDLSVG